MVLIVAVLSQQEARMGIPKRSRLGPHLISSKLSAASKLIWTDFPSSSIRELSVVPSCYTLTGSRKASL